jgi:hypothetical protein
MGVTMLLGFPRKTYFTFYEIEIPTKLYPNFVEISTFLFSQISLSKLISVETLDFT